MDHRARAPVAKLTRSSKCLSNENFFQREPEYPWQCGEMLRRYRQPKFEECRLLVCDAVW
jgi:hypothetical protein